MNKSLAIGIVLFAFLAGCGGGGGSGAVNFTVAATSVPRVVPTQGDYYTYSLTNTPSGGTPNTFTYTRAYSTVNPDGSSVSSETFSNGAAKETLNADTSFGITSYSYLSGGVMTNCSASPRSIGPSYPATTSTTWNNNWVSTCTGGVTLTVSYNNTGALTTIESVTTPAGTFFAGKEVSTVTAVNAGVSTSVLNETCWVDTVLGRLVKCNMTSTFTPVTGSPSSSSETVILTGYSAAGLSSSPTVARFAGTWSGSYMGSANSGTCSSLIVSTAGVITGSCVDIHVGAFTVSGTVNVAGTVNMVASTGVTFSGSLTSITTGSGTWIGVPSGGGTWTATHQ